MWRLLLLLAWPLTEIALFVVIGGQIGLWATLAWVLLTAMIGVLLLRFEVARGAVMLRQGRQGVGLREGSPIGGLFRALAAVLLILPGFLTDAFGLLLLLPPVQALLSAAALRRVTIVQAGMTRARNDDVIDGEWVEVPPAANRRRGPSAWVEADSDGGDTGH